MAEERATSLPKLRMGCRWRGSSGATIDSLPGLVHALAVLLGSLAVKARWVVTLIEDSDGAALVGRALSAAVAISMAGLRKMIVD